MENTDPGYDRDQGTMNDSYPRRTDPQSLHKQYGSTAFCPTLDISIVSTSKVVRKKQRVEQVATSTGLSPSDAWSVAVDQSARRALRPVKGQA